jgi:hypothetical protein
MRIERTAGTHGVVVKRGDVVVMGESVTLEAGKEFSKGRVGLETFISSFRFRNIKVTAPDGTLLWNGLPAVGSVSLSGKTFSFRWNGMETVFFSY